MDTSRSNLQNPSRRSFLKAGMLGTTVLAGCLEALHPKSETEASSPQKTPTETPTPNETGYQTRTFRATPSEHPGALVLREGAGSINVEVFSDYSVNDCKYFWLHTKNRLRKYYVTNASSDDGPKISIVLRHFPKPENEWSMFLPCAIMEVRAQRGIMAQAEFHNRLFENHFPDYSIRDVEIAASLVDADPDEVVKAGKERRRNYAIKWDIEEAEEYEFEEPLGIAVGGQPVWENSYEAIEQSIEREIAQRDL